MEPWQTEPRSKTCGPIPAIPTSRHGVSKLASAWHMLKACLSVGKRWKPNGAETNTMQLQHVHKPPEISGKASHKKSTGSLVLKLPFIPRFQPPALRFLVKIYRSLVDPRASQQVTTGITGSRSPLLAMELRMPSCKSKCPAPALVFTGFPCSWRFPAAHP